MMKLPADEAGALAVLAITGVVAQYAEFPLDVHLWKLVSRGMATVVRKPLVDTTPPRERFEITLLGRAQAGFRQHLLDNRYLVKK